MISDGNSCAQIRIAKSLYLSSSNELATAVAVSTINTIKLASQATIPDADAWEDVGATDVKIFTDSSATTSDAGRATLTVTYVQQISPGLTA